MREVRRRTRQVLVGLSSLCLVLLLAAPVLAQSTATLLGTVSDTSGGVLPGVTVTARHIATGLERTVVSAGEGTYRIPALPVGAYEIRVRDEAGAFRVIYVAKFEHAVYVLHAFHKKTRKTPKADIEQAARRYEMIGEAS